MWWTPIVVLALLYAKYHRRPIRYLHRYTPVISFIAEWESIIWTTTITIATILHNILFILHITSHIIIIQLHIAFQIIFMFHDFYKHSKNFISSYVMPTDSKEVDTGNNYMYPRVLSLYEIVISIYIVLYDPNGPL